MIDNLVNELEKAAEFLGQREQEKIRLDGWVDKAAITPEDIHNQRLAANIAALPTELRTARELAISKSGYRDRGPHAE